MKLPFIEEKKLEMSQFPEYVRFELTKRYIFTYILIACSFAALIASWNMTIFIAALVLTLLQLIYALSFKYLFTRDKVYIIEGVCDGPEKSATFKGIFGSTTKTRVIVPESNNSYYVAIPKGLIFSRKEATEGTEITVYFSESGMYTDSSGNVVINSPLIVKT